jgi:hypothetical protein
MKLFSFVTSAFIAVLLSACSAAKVPAKVVYVGGLPAEDEMTISGDAIGEENQEISYHAPSKWTTVRKEDSNVVVSLRPNTRVDDGLKRIVVRKLDLGFNEAVLKRLSEKAAEKCDLVGRDDKKEGVVAMEFDCMYDYYFFYSTIRLIDGDTYEVTAKWPRDWDGSADDYKMLAQSLVSKRLRQEAKEELEQMERLKEKARAEREARETAPDGRHIYQTEDFTYLHPEGWIVEEDEAGESFIKSYPVGGRDGDRQIIVRRFSDSVAPSEAIAKTKSIALENGCRTAYAGEIEHTEAYQLAVMCREEKTLFYIVRRMGNHTYVILGKWPYGETSTGRVMRQFFKDMTPR